MAISPHLSKTLNELLDTVFMEVAAYRRMSVAEEVVLKARLFSIMADKGSWEREPGEMARRFQEAVDGVCFGSKIECNDTAKPEVSLR
jgi:hypothetical protein